MDKNDNNERSKSLGNEPIKSLLIKHSIPAIVGMLVNAIYNIVDRVFIGRGVGGVAIGDIYLGMPLMLIIIIIIMAFAMLIGIGGNTLVSIRLGQQKKDEADQISGNSLMLFTIIGVIFSILGLVFLQPLLGLFGASTPNIEYATDYLRSIQLEQHLM